MTLKHLVQFEFSNHNPLKVTVMSATPLLVPKGWKQWREGYDDGYGSALTDGAELRAVAEAARALAPMLDGSGTVEAARALAPMLDGSGTVEAFTDAAHALKSTLAALDAAKGGGGA